MSNGASERELTLWKWVLIGMIVWIIGYVAIVPQASVADRMRTEHNLNSAFLGTPAASEAEDRAARWFTVLVVNHGWLDRSGPSSAATPAAMNGSEAARKVSHAIELAQTWASARVAVMWAVFYQLLTRVSVSAIWLPFLIVVLVPFVVDGWVVRKIKSGSFGRSSPHAFVFGRHFVALSPLLYVVLLLVPLPIPAYVLPVLCVVCGVSLWAAIAHFAKRA